MSERDKLLEALDFNGVHSGDVLAAAYFRQAAIHLRLLEGEADHWKRAARVERNNAAGLRAEVRNLRRDLASAIEARSGETTQIGSTEGESAVAESETPQ